MCRYVRYLILPSSCSVFWLLESLECWSCERNTFHSSHMTPTSPPYRRSSWRWRRAEVVEAAVAWLKMRFFLKLQVFLKGRKTCWPSLASSYLMPRDHWSVKTPSSHKILQLLIKWNVFAHLVPYCFCHFYLCSKINHKSGCNLNC